MAGIFFIQFGFIRLSFSNQAVQIMETFPKSLPVCFSGKIIFLKCENKYHYIAEREDIYLLISTKASTSPKYGIAGVVPTFWTDRAAVALP